MENFVLMKTLRIGICISIRDMISYPYGDIHSATVQLLQPIHRRISWVTLIVITYGSLNLPTSVVVMNFRNNCESVEFDYYCTSRGRGRCCRVQPWTRREMQSNALVRRDIAAQLQSLEQHYEYPPSVGSVRSLVRSFVHLFACRVKLSHGNGETFRRPSCYTFLFFFFSCAKIARVLLFLLAMYVRETKKIRLEDHLE